MNKFYANRSIPKKPLAERFWDKVNIRTDDECWLWIAHINKDGYGMLIVDGKAERAHRISYKLTKGTIPLNMSVLHRCDNPGCVNPNHLFLGTQAQNIADMVFKNRQKGLKGGDHPSAKLTNNDAIEIIKLRKLGWTCRLIAQKFNISPSLVSAITCGSAWKHIMRESIVDMRGGE
jgi:hypothetical protein